MHLMLTRLCGERFGQRAGCGVLVWIGVSLLSTAIVAVKHLGGHEAIPFVFFASAVHWGLWGLAVPLVTASADRLPVFHHTHGRRHVLLLTLILAIAAPIVSVIYIALLYATYYPYRTEMTTFGAVLGAELRGVWGMDLATGFVMLAGAQVWRVWQDLQYERTRAAVLEQQLTQTRLEALRRQLHPHFLFNTLHTIAGLIGDQPVKARRMVVSLGDFLRVTLTDDSAPICSLSEELAFVDLYMGIQKLRLGDRLRLDYGIDAEATAAEVPHLLLQPLFENAVRHGASKVAGPCAIAFDARRVDAMLRLTLENDAPRGPARQAPPAYGVGLSNTLARLRLHYGDAFTFQYAALPEGRVRIEISLPHRRAADGRAADGRAGDDGIGDERDRREPETRDEEDHASRANLATGATSADRVSGDHGADAAPGRARESRARAHAAR